MKILKKNLFIQSFFCYIITRIIVNVYIRTYAGEYLRVSYFSKGNVANENHAMGIRRIPSYTLRYSTAHTLVLYTDTQSLDLKYCFQISEEIKKKILYYEKYKTDEISEKQLQFIQIFIFIQLRNLCFYSCF